MVKGMETVSKIKGLRKRYLANLVIDHPNNKRKIECHAESNGTAFFRMATEI